MSRNIKHLKLFEFLTVFATMIGIVVGVGIYSKNDLGKGHVLGITQNPIMAIILWVIVGILGIAMIVAFMEIASSTKKGKSGTLANWFGHFVNRKTGSLVAIFNILGYIPIIYSILSYLIIDFILIALEVTPSAEVKLIIFLIGGVGVMSLFGIANAFTRHSGKIIQIIGLGIKLFPLIIGLFLGFINPASDNSFNEPTMRSWHAGNFFIAIAPILFSLDGFIYAANLQKEVTNKQQVPKALFCGMVFIIVFYVLLLISIFLGTNDGSLFTLFTNTLAGWFTKVIYWLIVISALVSLNGMTLTGSHAIHAASEDKFFFFQKAISLKWSAIYQTIIGIVWYLIAVLVSYFATGDLFYIIDQLSNAITVLDFIFYGLLILAAIVNRIRKKVAVDKTRMFWPFAILSVVILAAFTSYIIYSIFAEPGGITRWFLLGTMMIVVIVWAINEYLIKKIQKSEPEASDKVDPTLLNSKLVKSQQTFETV